MRSLLDDVSPDAKRLLDILLEAWPKADQWPIRQYVAHEMAAAGLDLVEVLRELPEWGPGYQAVRVFRDATVTPLQGAPAELGQLIVPTVYGLVNCAGPTADQMVKAFLASLAVGYARQMGFLPDPVKVKLVSIGADHLVAGIRQQLGPFGEVSGRQVRLMLAGEPATWLGVPPDPDAHDWTWNLWFASLRPFAVENGRHYLAALEEFIGAPPQLADSQAAVEPSALPRALDHLDSVWQVAARQRLFKRPGFARTASLAGAAAKRSSMAGVTDLVTGGPS